MKRNRQIKAIGYARVSTDEQRNEGQSIQSQSAKIKAYAESQDWRLVDIYTDEGYSGTSTDRPGLARLLADLEAKEIDIVLVYKVDRLTRRQRDLWTLLEDNFEKHGVGFKSVSEPFDTTTAAGKAFLSMIGTFAQLERDTIAERTADTLRHKKNNGEWIGRVPFGYRIGESGRLEKDPDEQKIIRRIRRMRSQGKSIREISKATNTGRGTVYSVINGHGNERNAKYINKI